MTSIGCEATIKIRMLGTRPAIHKPAACFVSFIPIVLPSGRSSTVGRTRLPRTFPRHVGCTWSYYAEISGGLPKRTFHQIKALNCFRHSLRSMKMTAISGGSSAVLQATILQGFCKVFELFGACTLQDLHPGLYTVNIVARTGHRSTSTHGLLS